MKFLKNFILFVMLLGGVCAVGFTAGAAGSDSDGNGEGVVAAMAGSVPGQQRPVRPAGRNILSRLIARTVTGKPFGRKQEEMVQELLAKRLRSFLVSKNLEYSLIAPRSKDVLEISETTLPVIRRLLETDGERFSSLVRKIFVDSTCWTADIGPVIAQFRWLEELDFTSDFFSLFGSSVKLREIPAGVSSLPCLKKLGLAGHFGIRIPADFEFPETLEELTVALCGLPEVPAGVGRLRCLKKLCLGPNDGIRIPVDFKFPDMLEELDLRFCNLREVPACVGGLPSLKKLCLSGNNGISIPVDFEFPAILEELNLSCCGLREVPAWIARRGIEVVR